MPNDWSSGRKASERVPVRAALLRVAIGAALASLVLGLSSPAVRAADGDNSDGPSFWTRFEQAFGLKKKPIETDSGITYVERSPLVVPPTRDLPPPSASSVQPTPDWPKDTAIKPRRHHAKAAPAAAAPATNSGSGGAAAGNATPAPSTPAAQPPPTEEKSFFKPSTWFNKEEYATFTAEPPRNDLTDPPAGYRTPSPDQPYGIGPEKKAKTKTAGDGTVVQTGSQASAQPGNPTGSSTGGAPGK